MSLRWLLIVLLVVCGGTTLAAENILFVAPDGCDDNAGHKDTPLATLEAARLRVRQLDPDAGPIIVNLRGGDYFLHESVVLTGEDSGRPDAPITYQGYPGETVRLFGGVVLNQTQFTPVTDTNILQRIVCPSTRENLLQIDLAAQGISDTGELSRRGFHTHNFGVLPQSELYIAGERMTLARWPNAGYVHWEEVLDPGASSGDPDYPERGGSFSYAFDRPQYWEQAADIWIDGIFSRDWAWSYNRVANIDLEKQVISLQYGEEYGVTSWVRNFFFFENILEEISVPGEYYIDRVSNILYLLPPAAFFAGAPVVLSTLTEPMLQLENCAHIRFQDLQLDTGRSSAIIATNTSNVHFQRLEVRNFARHGIVIEGRGNSIADSYIHNIGATAVSLAGGDWVSMEAGDNQILHSHIHHTGYLDKVYRPAITIRGVGQQIRHNLIHDVPHMGVEVRGTAHQIEYNEFFRISEQFRDMGAIYFNLGHAPQDRGTIIHRNLFHQIGLNGDMRIGVYIDSASMGITVSENIFHNIGPGSHGIYSNGGAHTIIENNMFIDTASPYMIQFFLTVNWGQSWLERFQRSWQQLFEQYDFAQLPISEAYPELLGFFEEDRLVPDTNTFSRNVIYNPTIQRRYEAAFNVSAGPVEKIKAKDNWIAPSDPGFVHLAAMDYRLQPNASVFAEIPGFQEIPADQIGIDHSLAVALSPQPFQLLLPPDGSTLQLDAGQRPTVHWQPSRFAHVYQVTVAEDPQLSRVVYTTTVNTNSAEIPGLRQGRTYYWQITSLPVPHWPNSGDSPYQSQVWTITVTYTPMALGWSLLPFAVAALFIGFVAWRRQATSSPV